MKLDLRNRRRHLLCAALLSSLLTPLLVVACGDDETATPRCPDLPLFNVRLLEGADASDADKAKFEQWKAEGVPSNNERCVTAPGTASIPDATFGG